MSLILTGKPATWASGVTEYSAVTESTATPIMEKHWCATKSKIGLVIPDTLDLVTAVKGFTAPLQR